MSLRTRLTVLLASIVVLALGGVFLVTYQGTGDDVLRQIDRDLNQDETTLDTQGIGFDASGPRQVARAASDYVNNQTSFGAGARLYVIRVLDQPLITNDPELLGRQPTSEKLSKAHRRRRAADAQILAGLPPGLHTVRTADAGPIRLLVAPVERTGATVALVGVGEPLSAVDRAKAGVARTFLLAGLVSLLIAVAGAFFVASRAVKPLRRMARTAAEIDAGDLSHRMRVRRRSDEVRVLADAFDRMLDRLEDAFASQHRFVADASHELRTPLTVIRGQLEVLARQSAPSAQDVRRVEGVVRGELVRMQRLVEDLLLLARTDEGQLVRTEEVEAESLVLDAWEPLTLTAERRWELEGPPPGELDADPDRIAQVIGNLVTNAVEHTTPGGLVRLRADARGGTLEIAVEDDGPGIAESDRDRVFDRFHRPDAGRSRRSGGAGLGLAIARAIVEAHGGTITAESSPENGARVVFRLPGLRAARAGRAGSLMGRDLALEG